MTVSVTHSKTLVSPDSGTDDKIYGADYVAADSHVVSGLGTLATQNNVTSAQINDATATGKSVLTAFDAGSARTAIGAGTSSFDGAYSSLSGVPSTFPPSAHATSHQNGGTDELALDATQVTSGQFDIARIASGTPDGTKFVRDDGTLATPAAGGVTDGDKGDITVSSTGATWTIDNGAVSLAKMGSRATQTFIGRNTAGSGAPEELSAATAKTMLNLSGTNTGDQTITLTGNVTGSGTGSFATTIASGVVTRSMFDATGKNWQFLGQGTASSAVRTGTVTWSGSFNQLMIQYFIAGYSGSAIGRVVVGPTAGISETATTFCTSLMEGVTINTTSVSVPGWPTAVTAGAVARYGWMLISNVTGTVKRMVGHGQHSGTAPTAVPTQMHMMGMYNNTSTQINKAELAVYATITGAAVSSTTFNAGTFINVWGRNDD